MYSSSSYGLAKRVGHEESHRGRGVRILEERSELGKDAQLCHGKGAKLNLESDKAGYRRLNCAWDSPRPLIGLRRLCDVTEDTEHKSPAADGRISDCHVR